MLDGNGQPAFRARAAVRTHRAVLLLVIRRKPCRLFARRLEIHERSFRDEWKGLGFNPFIIPADGRQLRGGRPIGRERDLWASDL